MAVEFRSLISTRDESAGGICYGHFSMSSQMMTRGNPRQPGVELQKFYNAQDSKSNDPSDSGMNYSADYTVTTIVRCLKIILGSNKNELLR